MEIAGTKVDCFVNYALLKGNLVNLGILSLFTLKQATEKQALDFTGLAQG